MTKKKKKVNRFEYTGVVVDPQYVFDNLVDETIGVKSDSFDVFSDKLNKRFSVYLNSQRYLLFKRSGCTCVECGLVADRCILIAEPNGNNRGHFEFAGVDSSGTLVIMTKDHIIPRSLGGNDILENYQPMCEVCNKNKRNECDPQSVKNAILSGIAEAIPNVTVKFNTNLDPQYHSMFKKWIDLVNIPHEYIETDNVYKFMPDSRSQRLFLIKYAQQFADIILATHDRSVAIKMGDGVDITDKNSILYVNKELSMSLYETIKTEKIKSMKDRNHVKTGILSVLLGEIERQIYSLSTEDRTNASKVDAIVVSRVKAMIENAKENYSKFPEESYQKEIEILSEWLPKVLGEHETKSAVDGVIAITGNTKNLIGKIMGELKKSYGNSMDMKIAKAYLDTILV